MAAFLLISVLIVSLLVLGLLVAPWSYQVGAAWTGLKRPSFFEALVITVIAGVATTILSALVGWIPLIGGLLSFITIFVVPAIVIQIGLETTFKRGLIIELISIVICSVIGGVVVGILFLLGATAASFQSLFSSVGLG